MKELGYKVGRICYWKLLYMAHEVLKYIDFCFASSLLTVSKASGLI